MQLIARGIDFYTRLVIRTAKTQLAYLAVILVRDAGERIAFAIPVFVLSLIERNTANGIVGWLGFLLFSIAAYLKFFGAHQRFGLAEPGRSLGCLWVVDLRSRKHRFEQTKTESVQQGRMMVQAA